MNGYEIVDQLREALPEVRWMFVKGESNLRIPGKPITEYIVETNKRLLIDCDFICGIEAVDQYSGVRYWLNNGRTIFGWTHNYDKVQELFNSTLGTSPGVESVVQESKEWKPLLPRKKNLQKKSSGFDFAAYRNP